MMPQHTSFLTATQPLFYLRQKIFFFKNLSEDLGASVWAYWVRVKPAVCLAVPMVVIRAIVRVGQVIYNSDRFIE
jgi:hypothetical protein